MCNRLKLPHDSWRIFTLSLSFFIIFMSFMFGPLNTIMVNFGNNQAKHHDFTNLSKPANANLLIVMSVCMWLLFLTNFSLIVCILTNKCYETGIDWFIIMTSINMIIAGTTGIYFFVYCTAHDTHCLGHSDGTDIPEALLLNGFCVLYLLILGVFLYVLFRYRIELKEIEHIDHTWQPQTLPPEGRSGPKVAEAGDS